MFSDLFDDTNYEVPADDESASPEEVLDLLDNEMASLEEDFGLIDDETASLEEDFGLIDNETASFEEDFGLIDDETDPLEEDFGLIADETAVVENAPGPGRFNELDEATRIALAKNVLDRTPHEVELVDLARNPDYAGQRSFSVDENGKAVVNEIGEIVDAAYGGENTQRPDGYLYDGVHHLREDKRYTDFGNLKRNITEQCEKRVAALGEDAEITFISAPTLSIGEADQLQDYVQNELGQDLEFQLK